MDNRIRQLLDQIAALENEPHTAIEVQPAFLLHALSG